MKSLYYKFMCDACGYSQIQSGMCPFCQSSLSLYSKQQVSPHGIHYRW